jgi:Protein of unknown function (DUF1549)/Protein of unknown function (DUF1553)/Planctomycete cytochrome C
MNDADAQGYRSRRSRFIGRRAAVFCAVIVSLATLATVGRETCGRGMRWLEQALGAIRNSAAAPAGNHHGVDFARDIEPVLKADCFECHGPEKQKGGLRLDMKDTAFEADESGDIPIVPGNAAKSELIRRISLRDVDEQMPPKGNRLPVETVALMERWVQEGAEWKQTGTGVVGAGPGSTTVTNQDRRHWSFLPLKTIAVPAAPRTGWARTPIDLFILSAQEAHGLHPNAEASRRMLIRRLYFDVLGLPPTPEQIDAFERDPSPNAYELLVDRLLADPHYGERWGRHWLDAARYADSAGYEEDRPRPDAYRYRDFVIRALNDDLPYDRFVQWQIGGDLLAPENPEALAATGFMTAAPDDRPSETGRSNQFSCAELDDIVSTTGSAILGLTIGCARCHDHKFDPIPSLDYYRLTAFFTSTERVERPLDQHAGHVAAGKSAPVPRVLSVQDGPEKKTHVLVRGDPEQEGPEVKAGFLSIFAPPEVDRSFFAGFFRRRKTRADLARWLTDVDHGAGALAARVAVNRIWQHHFGRGLVETPGDFGARGDLPTNPALLDWLAGELIRDGWRLKPLQKQILMSAAYRQDIASDDARLAIDPGNRLWWRREPQRVEAEILRDSILSASGRLNLQCFGPAVKPRMSPEAISVTNRKRGYDEWPANVKDGPETWRRSIYIFEKRANLFPFLQAFDAPNAAGSCTRRNPTTVAPQALALLNDPFMREQAWAFAARLSKFGGMDARVRAAFELALGRDPAPSEAAGSLRFIEAQANDRRAENPSVDAETASLADFCQGLMASNEFSYID